MKIATIQDLLKNSYQANKKSNIDGYTLDNDLSGTRAQVYKNADNKAVVVHRGTQGVQDVITDGLYALTGYKTNRFKHAEKVQKQAYDKYGKENTTSLGHSLGSLINNEVGKDAKQTINYNTPVVSIQDLLKGNKDNQHEIRSLNDPLSYARKFLPKRKNETTINNNPSLNPLAAHSTNELSKLDSNTEIGMGLVGHNNLNQLPIDVFRQVIENIGNINELQQLLNMIHPENNQSLWSPEQRQIIIARIYNLRLELSNAPKITQRKRFQK